MLYSNLSVNDAGHLAIGGIDALDLAERFGTPLYVLDEDMVRENCRTYLTAIGECLPEGSGALYASKALCFKGIYPVVESEGMCVDAAAPAATPSLFGPDPADERAEKREALSRALDGIRSRLGASVRLG